MQFLQPRHAFLNLDELPFTFHNFGLLLIKFELKICNLDAILFISHLEAGLEGLDLIIFE